MSSRLVVKQRKPRNGSCGGGRARAGELTTYGRVVRAYEQDFREREGNRELRFFQVQRTLADAVEKAALCKTPSGKRQPHQRRLSQATLRKMYAALKRTDLESAESFKELFKRVEGAIGGVSGVGELTVYDTSVRIGAYLRLEPERVYLHRGTRVGAEALGLGRGKRVLELNELPKAFHRLRPHEVEDCLCIYKQELASIAGR